MEWDRSAAIVILEVIGVPIAILLISSCNTPTDNHLCFPKKLVGGHVICLGMSKSSLRDQLSFAVSHDNVYTAEIKSPYFTSIIFTAGLWSINDLMLSSRSYGLHANDIDSVLLICKRAYGDSVQIESYQSPDIKTQLWAWHREGGLVLLQAQSLTTDSTGLFRDAFTVTLSLSADKK
jgi:hypothetical protein